ncbi:hypothetical protein [Leptospira alstonii]|uniref:Toxin-antitoxin system, antitoxin component, Xre domain protein n=2 Tax=Leptospira alstonii TaxID=28452 RepID=M6D1D8_9LEPT|nr:hypothetical protein [Leptospira alstonii]EMJ96496.1 toxin-antitoxin system, antitoxin component, Xre domain protein [Leptospira alstonii serovar Sichuan str. 79601]EQA79068.1 toxin-antitoxin system, antitoxin component, Xre domain protein [Leptospira alstonii serovar Pingchang str. 80-412]
MEIKPIKSKKDYDFGLKEMEGLWDAKKNTPEYDKLDIRVVEKFHSSNLHRIADNADNTIR